MRAGVIVAGLVLVGLAAPGAAAAQPRRAAVVVTTDAAARSPARLEIWRTHVDRAARTAGYRVVGDPSEWAAERARELGSLLPRRVAGFAALEGLLVEARQASASLQEGRALALLSRAERLAEDHADVAGSSGWLAEVETAIGITAAQAGLDDLMEVSLARAATLDATRGVRAAEAPPAVVERAEAIVRAVATRPVGSFEVRTDAPGARVYLDDEELGPLPRVVRAPVGHHVLRVEAPGHLPWGRVVQVLEGRRPSVHVQLAPDPLLAAARRLEAAAESGDLAAVHRALGSIAGLDAVWIAEVGTGPQDRALITLCSEQGCAPVRRVEVDEVPIVVDRSSLGPPSEESARWTASLPWLLEPAPAPPPPPPPSPWWQRWYVWGAAALVVGSAVGATILLTRPDPEQQLRVVVQPPD